MSKKKIAYIGVKGLPGFGGAARSTESLIHELKDEFDISVYSVDSHTDVSGHYNGIKQITFKSFPVKKLNTLFYYLKSLNHCLFYENYDLVHVQHIYAGFIIPFLRLRYKVINTVRGIIPKDDNKWNYFDKLFFKLSEYSSLKSSNEIVSVCQPHIGYLKKIYDRPISYIPNGVYLPKKILDKKKPENYMTFAAGRIISLKGLHILLDALHLMDYQGKLKVIGSLDHIESYKRTIIEKAKGLNVEFLGLIKDKNLLFDIVGNSKLFVFPSLNEGMSNMLLETAALKTPIIASDIIENKYVFNDEEVTFFQSNNHFDLEKQIKKCLENQDLIERKADLAFIKTSQVHNWKFIANEYENLYSKLLNSIPG
ncbi:glycosyltransferase family 4 protein [uncultured Christiangramia sp.]|uniref:glycosyltransferase family 4 protein n=1 Tax=Christiangramia sp. 3-2217-3z TaxID=3417564 RepID=UPI00263827DA|nr:glycosyltransferase family 4 protein [uncultured Christiangramia sp.]